MRNKENVGLGLIYCLLGFDWIMKKKICMGKLYTEKHASGHGVNLDFMWTLSVVN